MSRARHSSAAARCFVAAARSKEIEKAGLLTGKSPNEMSHRIPSCPEGQYGFRHGTQTGRKRPEMRVLGLKMAGIPILSPCARYAGAAVSRVGITNGEDSPTNEISSIAFGPLHGAD